MADGDPRERGREPLGASGTLRRCIWLNAQDRLHLRLLRSRWLDEVAQEYGRAAWNLATGPTITRADVQAAGDVVDAELDESFFRTRVQRSSPEELRYMRAMAHLGAEAHKAADVAGVLGKASEQVAPSRARLISKGLLYTPRHGYAKFTVPQFDRFMLRYMDLDVVPPA